MLYIIHVIKLQSNDANLVEYENKVSISIYMALVYIFN